MTDCWTELLPKLEPAGVGLRDPWEVPLRPRPIEERLAEPLQTYWQERLRLQYLDSYAGLPIRKFPEDLRVYERLMWETRPNVVIEIGTQSGASALWFRDRLSDLARYGRISTPRVISIDLDVAPATANLAAVAPGFAEDIVLLPGDVCSSLLARVVRAHLPTNARCLVIEDSAHTYATTMAALRHFSSLVPLHGFFIVEDGCVDIEAMRPDPDWPRGVLPAVDDWLASPEGSRFTIRRELEWYGISCHPRGFLQRIR
jgi:cephalosporin hydroxylase